VSGAASVYANVSSPNFVVQTKRGHVIVSSTFSGTLVDITNGANVVIASGFPFPNGLAIRKKYLYVADTGLGACSVSRSRRPEPRPARAVRIGADSSRTASRSIVPATSSSSGSIRSTSSTRRRRR
jgi:hypothetical protein